MSPGSQHGKWRRNGWLLLISAVLFVAACEIIFHWLLSRGVFPSLLAFYLYVDPQSKKASFAWDVINTAPAAVLGCANGWIGHPRWSVSTLCVTTVTIALFVASLTRAYGLLIGQRQFATVGGSWIYNAFTALGVAGFFGIGAYVFREESKRRPGIRGH